jgi:hypothetical protein
MYLIVHKSSVYERTSKLAWIEIEIDTMDIFVIYNIN